MYRRTLLRSMAAGVGAVLAAPFRRLKLFAQAQAIGAAETATLDAIAEVVLPAEIGAAGRQRAVAAFTAWVRNYKEGADRGYGYGASTPSSPVPASPAARYADQFRTLDDAARAKGARSFSALSIDGRREVVETALNAGQGVPRMPARPTGASLVADFMGLYFNSQEAWNLAYRAEINRDSCRSLDGSDRPPSPLGGR